jgi:hypothetical protein
LLWPFVCAIFMCVFFLKAGVATPEVAFFLNGGPGWPPFFT